MRDTIDMARESRIDVYGLGKDHAKFVDALKAFEALVRADERNRTWTREHWTEYEQAIVQAEREACAELCLKVTASEEMKRFMGVAAHYVSCSEAIRARGNT